MVVWIKPKQRGRPLCAELPRVSGGLEFSCPPPLPHISPKPEPTHKCERGVVVQRAMSLAASSASSAPGRPLSVSVSSLLMNVRGFVCLLGVTV